MTSIFLSLYRSVKASMQHLNAAGSRHSVVMSQNKMPFFGKSGTPRIEFATSSFFSSSNMVPGFCCSDTTEVRLRFLIVGQRACGNPVLSAGFRQGNRDGKQLVTNMQLTCGCSVRSSDGSKRLQNMLRNQALCWITNPYCSQKDCM